jgi:AcrR family transcriptional regulator
MVAERAGVQRHTVYAHFPDERSLFLACSGLALERSPLPDAEPWGKIASTGERLRAGLSALYEWFEQNEALAGCVLRDAEFHPLTKEITRLRIEPHMRRYQRILEAGFNMRQRALLRVALAFHTWRTLAREGGLAREDAVATMVDAIERQAA